VNFIELAEESVLNHLSTDLGAKIETGRADWSLADKIAGIPAQ